MKKIDIKNMILLFDLDGTLVDTEKVAERVLFEHCVEKGLINQETNLKKASKMVVGRTWKAAIRTVIDEFHLSVDAVQLEIDLKERYKKSLKKGIDLIPGVKEKLLEFKAKSRFMGIVTGSAREEVELVLNAEGLGQFFSQSWCAEDYSESKPSPAPFLKAWNDLQLNQRAASKNEVLIFEDSIAGMQAAHRAGFSFIQVCHAHPGIAHDPRALFSIQTWSDLTLV